MTPTHFEDPTIRPRFQVREIGVSAPWRWLRLAWRDFVRAGWPAFLHGLIVTAVGGIIVAAGTRYWPVVPGAISGFVLVGPVLATGLYGLSRDLAAGRRATIAGVLDAWRKGARRVLGLGLLLVLAGTAWVGVSMLLFHFFIPAPIDSALGLVRYAVTQADHLFLLWCVAGGIGAALVFGATVVTIPLLFEHDIGTREAVSISIRAVGENPYPMALWATMVIVITAISMASFMLIFLFSYPLLGHASWHAYRELVGTGAATSPAAG